MLPQAIYFDLFETLVTECDSTQFPMSTLAERLGVEPQRFAHAWQTRQDARMRGIFPDFASVLREIGQALNHPFDEEVIARLAEERQAAKARPFAQVEHPILEGLCALRRGELKLGVISNCSADEVLAWQTSPLAPLFDTVVFSCQVGSVKPEARIYHLACERFGVLPEQALFIGDGGSGELEGATCVGMQAYQALWFLERQPGRRSAAPFPGDGHPALRTFAELHALLIK